MTSPHSAPYAAFLAAMADLCYARRQRLPCPSALRARAVRCWRQCGHKGSHARLHS